MCQKSLYFNCHSGLDRACPVLDTGESIVLELDVLARFGSLRLPSVAPLEFTPHLIRGGNDRFGINTREC